MSSLPVVSDATFDELLSSGPPSDPLPFPKPTFTAAKRFSIPVRVPEDDATSPDEGRVQAGPSLLRRRDSMAGNVLVPLESHGKPSTRAYWIQRKLAKTTYGSVRVGYLLRPGTDNTDLGDDAEKDEDEEDEGDEAEGSKRLRKSVQWEVIPEGSDYKMIAIKMYEKSKIDALRGRRMKDPLVDLCVLQMLHPDEADSHHILGTMDTLEDDRFIYNIMPYSGDGDLFHYIERAGRLEEGAARHFFRQLLKALELLQRVGLCHRDICLENVLLRGSDCFIIGKGKCLRIPYSSVDSPTVTDVASGTVRRLITPQGQCGRPNYMAPETLGNKESFDGHAIDLWAAGIVLFYMLFGTPPFVWATDDCPRFQEISVKGELISVVRKWEEEGQEQQRSISREAVDLLQNMLKVNPHERLNLKQVMDHEWVSKGEIHVPPPMPSGLRNMVDAGTD